MFIIVYCRIIDGKKKGIDMDGPFFGPECETMGKAHEEAKILTDSSRDTTLLRIYSLDEHTYYSAKGLASEIFDGIYENMLKAASIIERPSSRSRRKKKKKAKKAADKLFQQKDQVSDPASVPENQEIIVDRCPQTGQSNTPMSVSVSSGEMDS